MKQHTFGKALLCAMILLLLLSLAGMAGAEKTVLLTFTGDCTLGSMENKRGREDSFDFLINLNGYDYLKVSQLYEL